MLTSAIQKKKKIQNSEHLVFKVFNFSHNKKCTHFQKRVQFPIKCDCDFNHFVLAFAAVMTIDNNRVMERERDPRLTLMSKRDMGDRAYDDITGRHTNNW